MMEKNKDHISLVFKGEIKEKKNKYYITYVIEHKHSYIDTEQNY